MTDTSSEVQSRYEQMLLGQSPARRLAMACRMFGAAKALALAGIQRRTDRPPSQDSREALFLKFYGHEFDARETKRILSHLRAA